MKQKSAKKRIVKWMVHGQRGPLGQFVRRRVVMDSSFALELACLMTQSPVVKTVKVTILTEHHATKVLVQLTEAGVTGRPGHNAHTPVMAGNSLMSGCAHTPQGLLMPNHALVPTRSTKTADYRNAQ